MKSISVLLITILIFTSGCGIGLFPKLNANILAKRQAREQAEEAERKPLWDKYQPYVDSLVRSGVVSRETALSILGRPNRATLELADINFSYPSSIIGKEGWEVIAVHLIFNGKDELKNINILISTSEHKFIDLDYKINVP